jgi:N-methylhydantoinase A
VFAVRDEGSQVEVVNWKARLTAKISHSRPAPLSVAVGEESKPSSFRNCFFGGAAPVKTAVFKPSDIHSGNVIAGPAIVEEPTTTLVIYPGMSAQVSRFGNYLLRVDEA